MTSIMTNMALMMTEMTLKMTKIDTLVIKMAEMVSKVAKMGMITRKKCETGWQLSGHPAHAWRGCRLPSSEVLP